MQQKTMQQQILRRWLWVGTGQVIMSLILAAIAPSLINSSWPLLGFGLWATIVILASISSGHVITQLIRANHCRRRFVQQFPEHRPLGRLDFLGIPPSHLEERLEQYRLAQADPDFQHLDISPLAFIQGGLS